MEGNSNQQNGWEASSSPGQANFWYPSGHAGCLLAQGQPQSNGTVYPQNPPNGQSFGAPPAAPGVNSQPYHSPGALDGAGGVPQGASLHMRVNFQGSYPGTQRAPGNLTGYRQALQAPQAIYVPEAYQVPYQARQVPQPGQMRPTNLFNGHYLSQQPSNFHPQPPNAFQADPVAGAPAAIGLATYPPRSASSTPALSSSSSSSSSSSTPAPSSKRRSPKTTKQPRVVGRNSCKSCQDLHIQCEREDGKPCRACLKSGLSCDAGRTDSRRLIYGRAELDVALDYAHDNLRPLVALYISLSDPVIITQQQALAALHDRNRNDFKGLPHPTLLDVDTEVRRCFHSITNIELETEFVPQETLKRIREPQAKLLKGLKETARVLCEKLGATMEGKEPTVLISFLETLKNFREEKSDEIEQRIKLLREADAAAEAARKKRAEAEEAEEAE